jgi:hypothetical protein
VFNINRRHSGRNDVWEDGSKKEKMIAVPVDPILKSNEYLHFLSNVSLESLSVIEHRGVSDLCHWSGTNAAGQVAFIRELPTRHLKVWARFHILIVSLNNTLILLCV